MPRSSERPGLDLLHRHGCPGHVHLAALPVFIVLAIPDQAMSSSGRVDGDYQDPSERAQAREGASGVWTMAGNCMASFGNFGAGVNHYYPPDGGFLAANGKTVLDDCLSGGLTFI